MLLCCVRLPAVPAQPCHECMHACIFWLRRPLPWLSVPMATVLLGWDFTSATALSMVIVAISSLGAQGGCLQSDVHAN